MTEQIGNRFAIFQFHL